MAICCHLAFIRHLVFKTGGKCSAKFLAVKYYFKVTKTNNSKHRKLIQIVLL